MRILLLNQYYYPDIAATAQLAADLAEELVRQGHDVSVVASDRRYLGGARLPLVDVHRGVRILRVPATAFGRRSKLLRIIDYATFYFGSLFPALLGARPDVIVALSTPPFIAGVGAIASRVRGAKLVFWVMDVYPDVAIELGTIPRSSAIARGLQRFARRILREADAIVALDEAMRDHLISTGAPHSVVEIIDNWCDGDAIRPASRISNPIRRRLELRDTFTISYSGNMGLGHDFATVTEAMALLRDEPIHWLFIGDGPRRRELQDRVRAAGLSGYSFLPYQPRSDISVSMTAADASIVTVNAEVAGLLVPSKLYGILAAGLPIIYVGPPDGRVAEVIRDHRVGIAVRNNDSVGLADGIRRLLRDRPSCIDMGRRARQLLETRYDRRLALDKHHRLLLRVGNTDHARARS